MLLKYGRKENLEKLRDGNMYFSPCKNFQQIEKESLKRGQGDEYDGKLKMKFPEMEIHYYDGMKKLTDVDFSVIVSKSKNTPVFCIKIADDYHITKEELEKIKRQSPDWTHVMVINDEKKFLENVRYKMKNRAFAHKVFYEDEIYVDYVDFLKTGQSDIQFYNPKKKKGRYYMELIDKKFDETNLSSVIKIDDSNYFKTMYKKSPFFKSQNEYRIVLPYESIDEGKIYKIDSFDAGIYKIEETVSD